MLVMNNERMTFFVLQLTTDSEENKEIVLELSSKKKGKIMCAKELHSMDTTVMKKGRREESQKE